MKKLLWCLLFLLSGSVFAAPVDKITAALRPTCTNGRPMVMILTETTADDDCTNTGGGSFEVLCQCMDGTWSAVAGAGGSGDSITVNSSAATDPDFLNGDIDWTLTGGNSITATVACSGCVDATDLGTDSVDSAEIAANAVGTSEIATDGVAAAEIAADAVGEAELKVVNACTDEYVLTCETTGGDFEWQPEGSTTGAPYNQYDPDKPPASCAVCEEWTNDTATQTWAWYNQDSSTESINNDGVVITGDLGADELHGRYVAAPANSDQTVSMVMWLLIGGGNGDSCGIEVLYGGSESSPTAVAFLYAANFSTDGIFFQTDTDYNPTAGASTISSFTTFGVNEYRPQRLFLQLRDIDSTRALTAFWSFTGKDWTSLGAGTTLTADPISWSYFARREGTCRIDWWRLRTDAGRNDASD